MTDDLDRSSTEDLVTRLDAQLELVKELTQRRAKGENNACGDENYEFMCQVADAYPQLRAELLAARAVCEAVTDDLRRDRDQNAKLFSLTDAEWIASLGDGEKRTLEALAAWRRAREQNDAGDNGHAAREGKA